MASGTILAWSLGYMGEWAAHTNEHGVRLSIPKPIDMSVINMLLSGDILQYMSVCIPMGIFNVVGSLQNIESAEAGGDKFETFPSLLVNGLGSLTAFFLGSCFPTTIYIGHPGWKALGARTGYSALKGIFVTFICLTGTVTAILRIVPLEAGIGILIVAQAFLETPKHHAPAVAIGFFPALAAWGLLLVDNTLRSAGTSLFLTGQKAFGESFAIHGMLSLERGFIFTSMIFSTIAVFLIEKDFLKACFWSLGAAAFSFVGIIHAYEITPDGVVSKFGFGVATDFAIGYCFFCCFIYWYVLLL